MPAVKPLAGQLDISDIADAIASDAGATALLGASFLELAGGTMSGDIELDTNKLRLDTDLDTFIDSTVDDQIDFWAGGAVELRLTASSLNAMSKPIVSVTDPSSPQDFLRFVTVYRPPWRKVSTRYWQSFWLLYGLNPSCSNQKPVPGRF